MPCGGVAAPRGGTGWRRRRARFLEARERRRRRRSDDAEAGRRCDDRIAVAHPDGLFRLEAGEEVESVSTSGHRPAVLAALATSTPPPERARATACRSRGRAPARRARIGSRGERARPFVHALRAARKDDARRVPAPDLLGRRVGGRTTEKTRASRTRRAISCVYWPPKSRMTIARWGPLMPPPPSIEARAGPRPRPPARREPAGGEGRRRREQRRDEGARRLPEGLRSAKIIRTRSPRRRPGNAAPNARP